jgi:hypothetical protein
MFEHLGKFALILVTGPQRSGTTIAARMIAADTGKQYVDEQAFEATDEIRFEAVLADLDGGVVQCPGMAFQIHRQGARDDVAVVFVRRAEEDIIASQRRIDWTHNDFEASRYGRAGIAARIKYEAWDDWQRSLVRHPYDVEYERLAAHQLWVSKERRRDFSPRQWMMA